MPRKVKHRELDSREARSKLKPRGMPYYGAIDKKLHLGYRRLKGKAGTWWARHYIGEREYDVEALGVADDLSDADGTEILNYWQAQTKAREAHDGAHPCRRRQNRTAYHSRRGGGLSPIPRNQSQVRL